MHLALCLIVNSAMQQMGVCYQDKVLWQRNRSKYWNIILLNQNNILAIHSIKIGCLSSPLICCYLNPFLFFSHSLSNTLWCNNFSVWHQWIGLIINAWPATHRHGCRLISVAKLQHQFWVKIWQHIPFSW